MLPIVKPLIFIFSLSNHTLLTPRPLTCPSFLAYLRLLSIMQKYRLFTSVYYHICSGTSTLLLPPAPHCLCLCALVAFIHNFHSKRWFPALFSSLFSKYCSSIFLVFCEFHSSPPLNPQKSSLIYIQGRLLNH